MYHVRNLGSLYYLQTMLVYKVTKTLKAAMLTPVLMWLSQHKTKGEMASAAFQGSSTALFCV